MREPNLWIKRYDQAPTTQEVQPTQSASIPLIVLESCKIGRFPKPQTIEKRYISFIKLCGFSRTYGTKVYVFVRKHYFCPESY